MLNCAIELSIAKRRQSLIDPGTICDDINADFFGGVGVAVDVLSEMFQSQSQLHLIPTPILFAFHRINLHSSLNILIMLGD